MENDNHKTQLQPNCFFEINISQCSSSVVVLPLSLGNIYFLGLDALYVNLGTLISIKVCTICRWLRCRQHSPGTHFNIHQMFLISRVKHLQEKMKNWTQIRFQRTNLTYNFPIFWRLMHRHLVNLQQQKNHQPYQPKKDH